FDVKAEIDLNSLYNRLVSETQRLLNDYGQRGLTGDALAEAVASGLEALSDAPLDLAGRGAVTEAMNLGRNVTAQRLAPGVKVVRTEILDERTCGPCWKLDGFTTTVNGPGYFENMPPNWCKGLDLCRGFYQ